MFKEIVERQQAEFFEKQSALISTMGDKFKDVMAQMPKLSAMSFGDPPYIIDDGNDALLLIDANGGYSRLPPNFGLADGTVKEGFGALYSLPLLSTGQVIRFIPANGDYEFPVVQASSPAAQEESDGGFFTMADQIFQVYLDGVVSLTKERAARRLMDMQGALARLCAENNVSMEDVLGSTGFGGSILSVFGEALTEASRKVVEAVENDREQESENDE